MYDGLYMILGSLMMTDMIDDVFILYKFYFILFFLYINTPMENINHLSDIYLVLEHLEKITKKAIREYNKLDGERKDKTPKHRCVSDKCQHMDEFIKENGVYYILLAREIRERITELKLIGVDLLNLTDFIDIDLSTATNAIINDGM